jgi:hypothetical protein
VKSKTFERLPQPSDRIWAARLDDTELPDEEYPVPVARRVLEFALHAGEPWRDWPTEDAEGLTVVDDRSREHKARHLGAGRYDVAGTVLYVGGDSGIPVPNIWQPGRNCVVDFGILAFAAIDTVGAAALVPGVAVRGQIDLLVDYAINGTPLPMIYTWKVLRVANVGSRTEESPMWPADDHPDEPVEFEPDILCAQLLELPPKQEREDYSIVLERMSFRQPHLDAVSSVTGVSIDAARTLFESAPVPLLEGLTRAAWADANAGLRKAGVKVSHEWTPYKEPGISIPMSDRKISRTFLRGGGHLRWSKGEGWVP